MENVEVMKVIVTMLLLVMPLVSLGLTLCGFSYAGLVVSIMFWIIWGLSDSPRILIEFLYKLSNDTPNVEQAKPKESFKQTPESGAVQLQKLRGKVDAARQAYHLNV